MPPNVTSLAAFRRFLAEPGATVTLTRHDWADKGLHGFKDPAKRAASYEPRTVAKLQTNAVKWSNGGWLHWDGKLGGLTSKSFRFEGDTVTVSLSNDNSFTEVFAYRLSRAAAP